MISTSHSLQPLEGSCALRANIHCFGRDMCCVEICLDGRSFYLWCRCMPYFAIKIRHPAFHKVMTSFLIKWLMRTATNLCRSLISFTKTDSILQQARKMCLEKVHPADTFHLHPHVEGFHVPGTTSPSIGREKSSLVDNSPFRAWRRPKNIPMLKIHVDTYINP